MSPVPNNYSARGLLQRRQTEQVAPAALISALPGLHATLLALAQAPPPPPAQVAAAGAGFPAAPGEGSSSGSSAGAAGSAMAAREEGLAGVAALWLLNALPTAPLAQREVLQLLLHPEGGRLLETLLSAPSSSSSGSQPTAPPQQQHLAQQGEGHGAGAGRAGAIVRPAPLLYALQTLASLLLPPNTFSLEGLIDLPASTAAAGLGLPGGAPSTPVLQQLLVISGCLLALLRMMALLRWQQQQGEEAAGSANSMGAGVVAAGIRSAMLLLLAGLYSGAAGWESAEGQQEQERSPSRMSIDGPPPTPAPTPVPPPLAAPPPAASAPAAAAAAGTPWVEMAPSGGPEPTISATAPLPSGAPAAAGGLATEAATALAALSSDVALCLLRMLCDAWRSTALGGTPPGQLEQQVEAAGLWHHGLSLLHQRAAADPAVVRLLVGPESASLQGLLLLGLLRPQVPEGLRGLGAEFVRGFAAGGWVGGRQACPGEGRAGRHSWATPPSDCLPPAPPGDHSLTRLPACLPACLPPTLPRSTTHPSYLHPAPLLQPPPLPTAGASSRLSSPCCSHRRGRLLGPPPPPPLPLPAAARSEPPSAPTSSRRSATQRWGGCCCWLVCGCSGWLRTPRVGPTRTPWVEATRTQGGGYSHT